MEILLNQIEKGLKSNLYYLSLFVSLCIPDICGALESNGIADSTKYKKWIEKYMVKARPDKYGNQLSAEHIWQFRCALLHQGRSKHNKSDYKRIMFFEPGVKIPLKGIHCCIISKNIKDKSLIIDIKQFCADIISGTKQWQSDNSSNKNYISNYDKLIKRYPNGISPIFGCPVIG